MFSIFKGNNFYRARLTVARNESAAPHPRFNYPQSFKTVGRGKRFTDGRTDRQTDGRTDAEGHNIKRPFFKWAYKNLVKEICHTLFCRKASLK